MIVDLNKCENIKDIKMDLTNIVPGLYFLFNVDENTVLFGLKSEIDSLSLVSVIVDLETEFYDSYNIEISLTDDRAMTRQISPYDNISVLTDYIVELVAEKL